MPAPDEADDAPKPADLNQSLELMVRQQGRAATGWALITMGFQVLFGGGHKEGPRNRLPWGPNARRPPGA